MTETMPRRLVSPRLHGVCGRDVELGKAVRSVSDCLTSSAAVGLSRSCILCCGCPEWCLLGDGEKN